MHSVQVNGLSLAYRELGSGSPVLLLHGWPTSSYLWRDVMPPIAERNRVIALDLPGFGGSDKPVGVTYDFAFFAEAIDGFLEALGVEATGLAVHDLGGPVGVHWALRNRERVTRLALLNTLVYPEFSDAVLAFINACSNPDLAAQITSPQGLEAGMKLGLADDAHLTDESLAAVQAPFESEESRRALAAAGIGLEVEGFAEIARELPSLEIPVRVVYGERDRILPDVAETMARVKRDLPQAEVTSLPECGHFLQEEAGPQIGSELARFFAAG
jgi:haloalkane dehalogenase